MARVKTWFCWAVACALASGCRDDCDRAVARLQRIEARHLVTVKPSDGRGLNPLLSQSPGERTKLELDECHDAKVAAHDPALACAMTSDSDEAAAACLARMLHDVVHERPPATESTPAVHEQRCDAVKATWRGEHDATTNSDRWDTLTIEVDGRAKPFVQDLTDFAPDARSPELFSPDCRHVLLLVGRTGPYHVIATERMAAYLDGAKPDYVLAGEKTPLPDGDGYAGAGVFQGGGWLSNTTVAYTWGCCDPPVTTKFELPRQHD